MAHPSHLITIASEQLWPQLLGLQCLLERDGGVRSLHVVHSADALRSHEPAKRLERLARRLVPGMPVHLHVTGTSPQDVSASIDRIVGRGDEEPWSLNCTGGTKLMFAGLVEHIAAGRFLAFYREVTGDWYRLRCAGGQGGPHVVGEPWPEAAASRLDVPVRELVEAQAETPEGATWSESPLKPVDALDVVREGIRVDWRWDKLAEAFPVLPRQAGFAFEVLMASCVRTLGLGNMALNLMLTHGKQSLQEFDIVVSTGQNLVLFDVKLSTAGEAAQVDHVMRIASNRTALGGLGGKAIAVRPSWSSSEELQGLAKSLSVELWAAAESWQLMHRLARVFGMAPDMVQGAALEIDSLLRAAHADGRRLFTYEKAPRLGGDEPHVEEALGVLNLTAYLNGEMTPRDRPVLLADYGPWLIVCGRTDYCGWGDRKVFTADMAGMCTVVFHSVTQKKGTFLAVCQPFADAARPLLKKRIVEGRRSDEFDRRWEALQQQLQRQPAAHDGRGGGGGSRRRGGRRHGRRD